MNVYPANSRHWQLQHDSRSQWRLSASVSRFPPSELQELGRLPDLAQILLTPNTTFAPGSGNISVSTVRIEPSCGNFQCEPGESALRYTAPWRTALDGSARLWADDEAAIRQRASMRGYKSSLHGAEPEGDLQCARDCIGHNKCIPPAATAQHAYVEAVAVRHGWADANAYESFARQHVATSANSTSAWRQGGQMHLQVPGVMHANVAVWHSTLLLPVCCAGWSCCCRSTATGFSCGTWLHIATLPMFM